MKRWYAVVPNVIAAASRTSFSDALYKHKKTVVHITDSIVVVNMVFFMFSTQCPFKLLSSANWNTTVSLCISLR